MKGKLLYSTRRDIWATFGLSVTWPTELQRHADIPDRVVKEQACWHTPDPTASIHYSKTLLIQDASERY